MADSETVPLKEYLLTELGSIKVRIDYMETVQNERKEASDKALAIATEMTNSKLEHLNNNYAYIKEQGALKLDTILYHSEHEALKNDVELLKQSKARLEGKADQSSVERVSLIAAIGIILSVMGIILGFFGK